MVSSSHHLTNCNSKLEINLHHLTIAKFQNFCYKVSTKGLHPRKKFFKQNFVCHGSPRFARLCQNVAEMVIFGISFLLRENPGGP